MYEPLLLVAALAFWAVSDLLADLWRERRRLQHRRMVALAAWARQQRKTWGA